jgi:hypothetical protein
MTENLAELFDEQGAPEPRQSGRRRRVA